MGSAPEGSSAPSLCRCVEGKSKSYHWQLKSLIYVRPQEDAEVHAEAQLNAPCQNIHFPKLPADLEAKLEQFLKQVQAQHKAYEHPAEVILNIDETPSYFDLIPGRILSKKGKRQIIVWGTTATKCHLTVVLRCTVAGHKLPPIIILKGKRELKLKWPPGYAVTVQKKRWMNGEHMTTSLKKIVLPYTKKAKTLLVLDSFSAHTDAPFTLLASKSNINLAVIPGRCTTKVQPLVVSVNKPFKDVA